MAGPGGTINLTPGDDTFPRFSDDSSGNETVNGLAGDDWIFGGIGDDILNGGDGADHLSGGVGTDTLDGGNGDDFLNGGDYPYSAGSDILRGGAGNDRLLETEPGSVLDGGSGIDSLRLIIYSSTVGLTIDISAGGGGADIGDGTTIADIEQIELTVESSGNDIVTGGSLYDVILSRGGNDTLDGGAGNDYLSDSSGSDTLNGGAGDDDIGSGYEGVDTIDGGTGIDRLRLIRDGSAVIFTIDLSAGGGGADIGDGSRISNIESLHFLGGSGNDTLTGGSGGDILGGSEGRDILNGGDGDDQLIDSGGFNTLNGGGGDDHALIGGDGSDLVIDISAGGLGADIGNGTTLINIERLTFEGGWGKCTITGGTLDDYLRGGSASDVLNGGAGNDTLYASTYIGESASQTNFLNGELGDDSLFGNAGSDILDGGEGADVATGGGGNDTYFVDNVSDIIKESPIYGGGGYDAVNTSLHSYKLGDGVERVNFTGAGNFVGTGNSLDNLFASLGGNDRFVDVLGGADIFSGGFGLDTVDFRASMTGAVLNFATNVHDGAAAGDSYSGIEKFLGSNTAMDKMTAGLTERVIYAGYGGDDRLNGGAQNDQLLGGVGDDTLKGNAGRDSLNGGRGNDTMTGGSEGDVFLYSDQDAAFGQDTIAGYQYGLDSLKVFSAVADNINDFTISGNGTTSVRLTLASATANFITINSAAPITIAADDFVFY